MFLWAISPPAGSAGHPLLHLYSVGKWAVATLLRLKLQDRADVWHLFEDYHRILALEVLFKGIDVSTPLILAILDFLPTSFRRVFFIPTIFSTTIVTRNHHIDKQEIQPALESIVDMVFAQKQVVARRLLRLLVKQRIRIRYTDRLGLAD
jgi:hypothetical protein